MNREQILAVARALYPDGVMNEQTMQIALAVAKIKEEAFHDFLMHLHERAAGRHNYFHWAANLLVEEPQHAHDVKRVTGDW